MKYTTPLFTLTCLCIATFAFAGCSKKADAQPTASLAPSPIASLSPMVVQVPKDTCGSLTAAEVSQSTGIKVGTPALITIQSKSGSQRYVCTYAKDGDPSIVVATATILYKKETVATEFQDMLEAQKKGSKTADGIGTEAYFTTVDSQPQLIMVTANAQFWIRMGKLNQSENTQADQLAKLGRAVLAN